MPKLEETLTVHLTGPDGNAFCILANVIHLMKQYGCSQEEIDEYKKDATSGDYDHLLKATSKIVELDLI